MLHQFLTTNRSEIIARTRAKVATRSAPRPTDEELENGIPLFLDQLTEALRISTVNTEAIGASAGRHGGKLLRMGFTIAQVVHDYGDVCQVVTAMADETDAAITTDEFHTLNKCVDDAIAEAVTEYTRLRERSQSNEETERLGFLAHELRNRLSAAMLAYAALKTGQVGIAGSTGAVLDRNLRGLRDLIDRSLAEVRVESGKQSRERISVSELVEEIELDASLDANARGVALSVAPVQRGLEVDADRPILAAAVTNLLLNAFKFSRAHGHVSLKTSATRDRVLFEVEDQCGGLPKGESEDLFRPFTQRGPNRKGLGLGLSISRKGIEANGGEVHVRDLPGKGCVFTIDLPRYAARLDARSSALGS
ncbi:MAG: HAMP domain-containing sensor histidine kinase [Acidobacteriota bacterium]